MRARIRVAAAVMALAGFVAVGGPAVEGAAAGDFSASPGPASETVAIDAAASGDVQRLVADLTALGLTNAAVWGRMVGGYLPTSSLDEAQALDSAEYVRVANYMTN